MKIFYSSSILAMLLAVILVGVSQANDRKLLNVISVTGECLNLVIEEHSCRSLPSFLLCRNGLETLKS
jgi:hypothetical protein